MSRVKRKACTARLCIETVKTPTCVYIGTVIIRAHIYTVHILNRTLRSYMASWMSGESHHKDLLFFFAQSIPVKTTEGHLQDSMGLMYAVSQR